MISGRKLTITESDISKIVRRVLSEITTGKKQRLIKPNRPIPNILYHVSNRTEFYEFIIRYTKTTD